MKSSILFYAFSVILAFRLFATEIHVSKHNPFYWAIDGETTLLIGGTVNDNLFQTEHLEEHLYALKAAGGNYVRSTLSSRDEGDVKPYSKNAEGLYDLESFNPEFWAKLEQFFEITARLGIIPQVEIWATYDFYWGDYGWASNPFNPALNNTYTAELSGLPELIDYPAQTTNNPFFKSVPALEDNGYLLGIQKAFVDKLLSISFKYDHILYCIDNETLAHHAWAEYWAKYLRSAAEKSNKHIYVTEMWDYWDPTNGEVDGLVKQHPDLGGWFAEHTNPDLHDDSKFKYSLSRPDLYSFLDVSNTNAQSGQVHYDATLWVRKAVEKRGQYMPITNVKVYGGDLNQVWAGTRKDGRDRFWRNIFSGHASVRFHRPTAGIGFDSMAQAHIRSARMLTDSVMLYEMAPANTLLTDREEDEAYCLANPDANEALLYFPEGGEVSLDMKPGTYSVHWLDISTATWGEIVMTELPGSVTAPTEAPWAVVVRRR